MANTRPDWCPHVDCEFRMRAYDSICGGRLLDPEAHDGDLNTHRLCLRARDSGKTVDIKVNAADKWWLEFVLEKTFEEPK